MWAEMRTQPKAAVMYGSESWLGKGRKPQPRQVGKWGRESEIGGLEEEEEDASFACLVLLLRICVSEAGHKKGGEEFRKQTDYISIVFIHTESARAGALVPVSLHLP